jgi:hypothetical protein
MAELSPISSSSPAQAVERPINAVGGGQGDSESNAVGHRVQIDSAGREQDSVPSNAQEASRKRIEAIADPSRNSPANQDIVTEVSDILEANTQNSSAAPEQNVSTLQREQAEQRSESGALSSAEAIVEQRGSNVNQLA